MGFGLPGQPGAAYRTAIEQRKRRGSAAPKPGRPDAIPANSGGVYAPPQQQGGGTPLAIGTGGASTGTLAERLAAATPTAKGGVGTQGGTPVGPTPFTMTQAGKSPGPVPSQATGMLAAKYPFLWRPAYYINGNYHGPEAISSAGLDDKAVQERLDLGYFLTQPANPVDPFASYGGNLPAV